jgi:CheY-like chemotaxis protein
MSRFRLKVLVADDATAIHSVFANIAANSSIPFDLVTARNGRECMEALTGGRINVAFIDVNMPEMNGMDAVDGARRIGTKTFITLMSTSVNKRRLQLARQLKVYDMLLKPFAPADVIAVLQTYCRVTVPSQALIVDDSATVRQIIKRVLANSIFEVDPTEAGDGDTALAYCQNARFDVVFLDCNMPGLDGIETLSRLLARDPTVKVVMISGEASEERRRRAFNAGAVAFLQKPFFPADIDRELHAIFGLRIPGIADVEPLRIGKVEPEVVPLQWSA